MIFTETTTRYFLSLLRNASLSIQLSHYLSLINAVSDYYIKSKHTKMYKMRLKVSPLPLSLRFQSALLKPKFQQMILFSFKNNHIEIFQFLSSLLPVFLDPTYVYDDLWFMTICT